ncbi:helix-turn-helix domain-containing protein [Aggregicoccus sp. 17bor-14]|uniref:GlxA family transcriptional regulator n=1 Tax=Myxococcaceae TaxID=31 RepID=UPI00129C6950|nr:MULTISPECIES: DJ-1/PfpI family protein [Myxococcaceae]MBF5045147.1 DJ-1/PfpI family protein [Simulacricoccus sp. 17bor-14]MRI90889.1 helix-turn-helix domain-containing protein [Aggregicoccus sp. 17bor-14]
MSPRASPLRKSPRPTARPPRTRRVAMLAFPDVQMLDVMGPLEVFARASRLLQEQGLREDDAYQVEILGLEPGPFTASSGLRLHADRGYAQVGRGLDTLLVAGGRGTERYCAHPPLLRWLRRQAGLVRRLASVCTGAFFLAEAGLLEGRSATTHWAWCDAFARRFPRIRLEPDRIFVKQGALYTTAGVTAGMDLALALVEEDHGRELALETARALVMFLRRPGGQAQFSAQLAVQLAEQEPLRELQGYIQDHPRADLSVPTLARRVAMSPRNFARVFTREVGMTPARFVTSTRVETARRLLEESSESLEAVCALSGLGTPEAMRRAFLHKLGIPPGRYRERFHPHAASTP